MSKYARFIWRNEHSDHSIQLVDVLDMNAPAYQPRPLLGCATDEELLSKLYSDMKDRWVSDDEWFLEVPSGVQDGATFTGQPGEESDPTKYINPDNTNGNGEPIPE